METVRDTFTLRSIDLRNMLGIAPATFADLTARAGIINDTPRRGAPKPIAPSSVRKILESKGYHYPDNAQVISFMICKGGVGKTTSTFFTAQRLSAYGARVLVVDADPQGNLTSAFNLDSYGLAIDADTKILVDVITGKAQAEETIIPVTENLHLIPSTPLNSNLDGKIRDNYKNPSLPFKKILTPLLNQYDYILIDCAPALNMTNAALICASNMVILPVSPDKFSQIGLNQTIEEVTQIESDFSFTVEKKILFTKYDGREFTSLKYLTDIAEKYDDLRFKTPIRTSADVKNAITKQEDLYSYKKSSAKEDYDSFVAELMGLDKAFKKSQKNMDV